HARGRDLHADHVRLAAALALADLRSRQTAAQPVVPDPPLRRELRLAQRLQALGTAEALEGVPGVEQLRGVRAVDLPALALAVRPLGAADVRALIPVQAEPAQRGENRGLALARAAHRVRVLDAQDE